MQICFHADLFAHQANLHAVRQWNAGGEGPLAEGSGQNQDQESPCSQHESRGRLSKWFLKSWQGHTVKIGALEHDKHKAWINRSANSKCIHVIFTYLICVLWKNNIGIYIYIYIVFLARSSVTRLVQVQAVLCVCECVCDLHTYDNFTCNHFVQKNCCCFDGFLFWLYFFWAKPHDWTMRYYRRWSGQSYLAEAWRYVQEICMAALYLRPWDEKKEQRVQVFFGCALHLVLNQPACAIPTQVLSLWRRFCMSMLPLGLRILSRLNRNVT